MPVFGFKDTGFEIRTESLGTLNFHRVTPEYAARIEKADFQHDLPPDAFLSLLLVILGSKPDGRPILIEEAYALSVGERADFVHAFLNEHGEYYRERVSEERKSDSGEKVVRSYLGDRIANPRHIGEEPAAYLARLYRDFASGTVTPEARKVEPPRAVVVEAHNDIFADSFLKNAALSESLGKSLAQMKMLGAHEEERSPATAPAEAADTLLEEPPLRVEPPPPPDADDTGSLVEEPPAPVEPPPPPVPPPPAPSPPPPPLIFPARSVGQPGGGMAPRMEEPPPADPPPADVAEPQWRPEPEPDAKQTFELMRILQDSVLRSLQDFAESAERNARAARTSRRIAILALFLALILGALPIAYLTWMDGLWGREFNKVLIERSAQAADQKQQIDALKAVADQLRAQRIQAPARVAD